jgi:hypothetical protein
MSRVSDARAVRDDAGGTIRVGCTPVCCHCPRCVTPLAPSPRRCGRRSEQAFQIQFMLGRLRQSALETWGLLTGRHGHRRRTPTEVYKHQSHRPAIPRECRPEGGGLSAESEPSQVIVNFTPHVAGAPAACDGASWGCASHCSSRWQIQHRHWAHHRPLAPVAQLLAPQSRQRRQVRRHRTLVAEHQTWARQTHRRQRWRRRCQTAHRQSGRRRRRQTPSASR